MRLSTDRDDPEYNSELHMLNVRVNGKLYRDVITAYEEEGFIIIRKTDDAGRYVVVNGIIQRDRVEGRVEIVGLPGRINRGRS